jgi:hypothetical protein
MQQPLPLRGEMDFALDLPKGLQGEAEVKQLLRSIFENQHFEVKTDFEAGRTGNVFVEVEDRGKKSGLSITKSPYWAFWLKGEFYTGFPVLIVVSTDRLRMLIKDRPLVPGGDGGLARGHLVSIPSLTKTLPDAPHAPSGITWPERKDLE